MRPGVFDGGADGLVGSGGGELRVVGRQLFGAEFFAVLVFLDINRHKETSPLVNREICGAPLRLKTSTLAKVTIFLMGDESDVKFATTGVPGRSAPRRDLTHCDAQRRVVS